MPPGPLLHARLLSLWLASYPSLPQKNREGVDDRSEALKARFGRALKGINTWYGHQKTYTLLVTTALPTGHTYTNLQPYEGRGWVRLRFRFRPHIVWCGSCATRVEAPKD